MLFFVFSIFPPSLFRLLSKTILSIYLLWDLHPTFNRSLHIRLCSFRFYPIYLSLCIPSYLLYGLVVSWLPNILFHKAGLEIKIPLKLSPRKLIPIGNFRHREAIIDPNPRPLDGVVELISRKSPVSLPIRPCRQIYEVTARTSTLLSCII